MAKIPANILKMALDAIDEPVQAIGRVVSDMPETAARALDDMAGTVDDWQWRGGKKGEVTGSSYYEKYNDNAERDKAIEQVSKAMLYGKLPKAYGNMSPIAFAKVSKYEDPGVIDDIMDSFRSLEQANVPREWTGKIVKSLGGFVPKNGLQGVDRLFGNSQHKNVGQYRYGIARLISDSMERMTNPQRETFLVLLSDEMKNPNNFSIDELAAMARRLT